MNYKNKDPELYSLFGSRVINVRRVQNVTRPMFGAKNCSPIIGETISVNLEEDNE